jgi:hypothetical protein
MAMMCVVPGAATPRRPVLLLTTMLPAVALRAAGQQQRQIKVFYAGVRWGLSLPRSAVLSRQQLAKALHDAYVGHIVSVGQGLGLHVVFVDGRGSSQELGPSRGGHSRADATRWRSLAKTAVRVYVR